MINFKTCYKCKSSKQTSEFHKDKLRNDNLFPYCKACRRLPKVKRVNIPISEVLSNYKASSSGCWEWSGYRNNDGYGRANHCGVRYMAHRLSYSYNYGVIKKGKLICHTCDNPCCINPEHLYEGSHQDNSNDMVNRGRQSPKKGEQNTFAKITEKQAIASIADKRKHKYIAALYCIAKSTVSGVKTGRNWSHLTNTD